MTLSPSARRHHPDMPEAMADLQSRVETLYAAKTTLEQELSRLRNAPPLVICCPPRPALPTRLALRLLPRLRRRRNLELIRQCGLFDPEWYRAAYPDVAAAGLDPAAHFLDHGARERRDPGPHFDTAHYLHLYPDIAAGALNPLVHYVIAGRAEQRSIRPGMPHGGGGG
jgi:hypothetical protein